MIARSQSLLRKSLILRNLFIRTEETPNANSLKFITGHKVMNEGVKEFNAISDTLSSPLAKDLLSIDGVCSVFYGPEFITVTKNNQFNWNQLKPDIFAAIMDQYNIRGDSLFVSSPQEGHQSTKASEMPTDASPKVVDAIVNIIDTRIRPAIQQDGGDVEYRGFVKGYVKLRMQGACKSCASSVITLRNGIENMLMHYIPEVRGVEQVSDEVDQVINREFKKVQEGKYPRDDDGDGDGGDNHESNDDIFNTIKPRPKPKA